MNRLFETAPLTWNQWLICLFTMVPMFLMTTIINAVDPPQAKAVPVDMNE